MLGNTNGPSDRGTLYSLIDPINRKYTDLGGPNGFLGQPTTEIQGCPDGQGLFQHFQNGSIYFHQTTGAHEVHGMIRDKWADSGWETLLGYPMTDETATPDGVGRYNHFRRLDGGETSIYWTPQTGANVVVGEIRSKWAELGWERSFLGYPTTDETDFPDGGRANAFEHGSIYWWTDVGAIELNDVVVHYTGLVCFGETDHDQMSTEDEPYVILGVVSPTGTSVARSQVYEDVDGGESRPDLIEIYRGKPFGINISILLMEHDFGDPNKYRETMHEATKAAAAGITAGITAIPIAGPFLAMAAAPLLKEVVPVVAEKINQLLHTGDDRLGEVTLNVSAKQMVVLAARTTNSVEKGVGFKLETPLFSHDGATYKVYFGLVPA